MRQAYVYDGCVNEIAIATLAAKSQFHTPRTHPNYIYDVHKDLPRNLHKYSEVLADRFLSIDPVTFLDTGNPGYFNRYAYTFNNPTNLIDPSGMGAVVPCGESGGVCPDDNPPPDQPEEPVDEIIATGTKQSQGENNPPAPSDDFFDDLKDRGIMTTVTGLNQFGYTGFGDCVGQSKVPIIGSAIGGMVAGGLSLPLVNKPRAGFGGGGPSGNKTSVISKASRAAFGNSQLPKNSALRGFGSSRKGAALGRVGSRGGQYAAAAAFGYTAGAVGGCAVAGNAR